MVKLTRIGLIGFTGVGKSTAADHLRRVHGFHVASTGAVCRTVAKLVFGNEHKSNLLALTGALQSIDRAIFLKAALREGPATGLLVIDALRYHHDYEYALNGGFHLIRITAPLDLRRQWLQERGQTFDFETDSKHASETQLGPLDAHTTIANDGTKDQFLAKIDALITQNAP